ncbi:MAG: hypothetical protein JXA54_15230 [Candidatus Heimdallarchaeota archaeon]|nr:hypothetical protein [Candidatus Heimdallarchaeota archaeon]
MVSGVDYQINSFLGPVPIIDGYIDDIEKQSTGKPIDVVLPWDTWNMGGDQKPISIEIGSIHTNTSYLYINTRINYNDITSANITYFLRKTGSDDYFDLKRINSITNSSLDGYRTPGQSWSLYDTEIGGTLDSEGKCYLTSKSITFELFIPINSNDSLGYDLNVSLEDEIELQIMLHFRYLNIYGVSNSYQWSNDDSCTITFLNTTAAAPLHIFGILLGIVVIPLVKVIRRNLKGKKINQNSICFCY